MCVCVCRYLWSCVCKWVCVYIQCVYVCMQVYVGICIYVCVYMCTICVCIYVHNVCICIWICVLCVCVCSFKIGSIKWSTSPGLSSCGIPTATLMASICQECLRALGSEAPWFSFPLLLAWGFVLFQFAAFSELSRSTEPPFIITLHFVIYTTKPLGVSSCIFTFIMPAV